MAVQEFEGLVESPQWFVLLARAGNPEPGGLAHMSAGGASYERGVVRKFAKQSKQSPLI